MKKLLIILLLCSTAMAAYEPFPIFDLKAGKITAREPWLLPQDGFETLRNCHLKDGVLEKRRGYKQFGQMEHSPQAEDLGTGNGSTANYTGTLANPPLHQDTLAIRDDTELLVDDPGCLNMGAADRVVIAHHSNFTFGDGATTDRAFSISAWIFLTDTGTQSIVSKFNTGVNREWYFWFSADEKLTFACYDNGITNFIQSQTGALTPDVLYHVVATYDGTSATTGMNIYVNGTAQDLILTDNSYAAMHLTTAKIVIGSDEAGGLLFADKIDNVMIFDVELSQPEIIALYNSGTGTEYLVSGGVPDFDDLVAHYPLNDNRASTTVVNHQGPLHNGATQIDNTEDLQDTSTILGAMTGASNGYGYIKHSTGVFNITFAADVDSGEDILATYDYSTTTPIMGIFNWLSDSDTEQLVIMDQDRIAKYNTTTKEFDDLTTQKIRFTYYDNVSTLNTVQAHALVVGDILTGATSGAEATVHATTIDTGAFSTNTASGTIHLSDPCDGSNQTKAFQAEDITDAGANIVGHIWGDSSEEEFTGDNTNFFWVENWKDIGYFTNGFDEIQKYDGTRLTEFFIDLTTEGGAENDINTSLLIFTFKSRLVILNTTENGTIQKQRARWSEINDPQTWKNANFVDAPTGEWIVGAGFLGDDMIVFFERSVWTFSYTGDPDFPFRWDRVDAVKGSFATMSLISFSDQILAAGRTQLIGTDGREAYTIDDKIPEFVVSWVVDSTPYSYGLLLDEERQAWISYTSTSATAHADGNIYADSAIILNYTDNAWATYGLPIHSLGQSALESDLTWNDVTEAWEDIDYAWADKDIQGGFPISLMGSQNGIVFQLNTTGSDGGTDIEFSAVTGRWNPYQTRQARLGWVDFLVDTDSGASFDVKFYINSEASAYQTSTINCTETGTARDKVWKRANSGAVADFHRLELTNNASTNRPRIHAIVPYFKPAGSLF